MTTIPENTTDRLNTIKINDSIDLDQFPEFRGERHERVIAQFIDGEITTSINDCTVPDSTLSADPFFSLQFGSELDVFLSPQQFATLRDQMNAIKL